MTDDDEADRRESYERQLIDLRILLGKAERVGDEQDAENIKLRIAELEQTKPQRRQ